MFALFYEPALALMTIAKNGLFRQILLAGLCLIYVSVADAAGDAANGKALYNTTNGAPLACASGACHGTNPLAGMNKILRGANAGAVIMNAIRSNKGSMGFLTSYISAAQADDIGAYIANPSAANTVSQTIGMISFLPTSLAVGDTTTVSATATSGLAVSFSSTTQSVCTVSGSTVTGITPGTCTIAADQAGNASYNAATQVTQNIDVSAATPPTCVLSASSTLVSAGSTSILTASCSPAATSYLWVGGTCAGTSGASCTVTPSATTLYTVAGVNSAGSGAVAAVTVTVAPPGSILVIEFYNTNLDNYFITADSGEAAAIDGGSAGPGWIRTGNAFLSGGSTSVCRFYGSQSPGPNSHFYTVDPAECQGLKDQQIPAGDPRKLTVKSWNFESLDFVSTPATNQTCPTGTTPVYRAYNNGFARGVDSNHRITSSLTAIQEVVNRGWSNEGVVMCAPN